MQARRVTCVFNTLTTLISFGSLVIFAQDAGDAPVSERHDRPTISRGQAGEARTHSWIRGENIDRSGKPFASASPYGLSPVAMRTAYGVSAIPGSNGGAGTTIAIVDAYDSPSAETDLNFFSTQFGLPTCTAASGCFTKVSQTGSATALPQRDSGWEVEINLDVQWAHAIAPNARILLVEARTPSTSDLIAAVDYAKQHANVVSMSWGSGEFGGQFTADAHLVASGVTFVASSGDTGGIVDWPASSTNVISVGGTQLVLNASNAILSETAWGSASTGRRGTSGSGGGCSTRETQPSYQLAVLPFSPPCSRRAIPDVAMAGGNQSAVSVYVSQQGGWFGVYGTSLSAPMWAGLVAVADGMRGTGGSLSAVASSLYAAGGGYFNDITSGNAGAFAAGPGWDFITGLGSPRAATLIPYLAQRGR